MEATEKRHKEKYIIASGAILGKTFAGIINVFLFL